MGGGGTALRKMSGLDWRNEKWSISRNEASNYSHLCLFSSKQNSRACSIHKAYRVPPHHLRHEDVVDWDVDELDEEADKTHHQEPDGGGFRHLHELCAERNEVVEAL